MSYHTAIEKMYIAGDERINNRAPFTIHAYLALRSDAGNAVVVQSRQSGLKHLRSRPAAPPQPVLPHHPTRAAPAAAAAAGSSSVFSIPAIPLPSSGPSRPPLRSSSDHSSRSCHSKSFGALAAPGVWPKLLAGHGYSRHRLTSVVLCPARQEKTNILVYIPLL